MDRRVVVGSIAAVAVGAAVYFSMAGGRARRGSGSSDSRVTSGCARSDGADGDSSARRAARIPEKTVRDAELRSETRERLRERLGASYPTAKPVARRPRASAQAAPPPPPEPAGASTGPRIEPKYIQERVREDFFPLARQCYEDALRRKPGVAGKVLLKFTIVGDEKIGGIVEESSIGEESTLRDDEFDTCMSESMMSMTFPPPKGGGTVTVTYPIDFSPGDDESDGGAAQASPDAGAEKSGADAGNRR